VGALAPAMKVSIPRLLATAAVTIAVPCFAQTGTVTFYSIGLSPAQQVKVALVPAGAGPFTGWLFDGSQRMAHAQRGRFIAFHLATGEHQFTVPYKSSGPGKTALNLTVLGGGYYCVRLTAKYVNWIVAPVSFVDSRIEQVPCQQALKEAGGYKRIDIDRVDPPVRTELDSSVTFPRGN
jgi:hypothetical protein